MFSHESKTFFSQKEIKIGSNSTLKCRGCLTQEPDMNSLFIRYEENTTLAKIIEESIGYVICEEEQFSKYLCTKCTKIIVDFVSFKKTFREATEYFKNLRFTQDIKPNTKNFNLEEVNSDCKDYLISSETNSEQKKEQESHKTEGNPDKCDTENSVNLGSFVQAFNKEQTVYLCQTSKKDKCKSCDKCFKSKYQLRRHERTIHQKKFQNRLKRKKISSKGLENNSVDVLDISRDVNSKKFCKVCRNIFSDDEFELHFESHKTHVCNTCGHRFIRKTDLNDHMETHLDICKYICQHCGKAFKVRTALNKHKRIHTNPREEICDVCGQRFNTRDTLKTHYKLKHIKSKDFQCNLCGLAFTLKSTLEKHIERHNPNRQRIYSCNLCNVSYINKYNLSRHHVIKHTAFENRPICEFCGKGYVKKIDLFKHLKKRHGQNDTQDKIAKESEQIQPDDE